MNIRAPIPQAGAIAEVTQADIVRILSLWAEARARFGKGGPFLFGDFCAADIIYAPVVTPLRHLRCRVPGFAADLHAGGVGARLAAGMDRGGARTRNG